MLKGKETKLIKKPPPLDSRSLNSIQKRKDDTRKKILVGACIIGKHQKNGTTEQLLAEMDIFLSRKQDRDLFGLSSIDKS